MYVSSLCKSMDYIMDLFGVLGLTIGLLGFAASGTQYVISYIIQPKSNVFYYIAFGIGVIFEMFCFLIDKEGGWPNKSNFFKIKPNILNL